VTGARQTVRAVDGKSGKRVASLELEMVYGHPDPGDEIRVDGDPPVRMVSKGGVQGDRATVGTVMSAIRAVRVAPPGWGPVF
jgi:hypothetical protein